MNLFEQISKFIAERDFQNALQIASQIENETDRLNALGIVYFYMENYEKAFQYLSKVLEIEPFHSPTLFNIAKLHFQKGDYEQAWKFVIRMPEKIPARYELLGDIMKSLDNLPMAVYYYKKAINSNSFKVAEKLKELEQIRTEKNVCVFAHPGFPYFSQEISEILSALFNVRLVIPSSSNELIEAYNWADIVWFEGINEIVIEISNKMPKNERKVILRVYEPVSDNILENINWFFIDQVIFTNAKLQTFYEQKCEELISIKKSIIEKGINLSYVTPSIKKAPKKIALIPDVGQYSVLNLVEIARSLSKENDFEFYLKVPQNFSMELFKTITFQIEKAGLQDRFFLSLNDENFYDFLSNKSSAIFYTLSETIEYPILLAMAMGISTFVFASNSTLEASLPPECLFYSQNEVVNRLHSQENNLFTLREFVENNFSLEKETKKIIDTIRYMSDEEIFDQLIVSIITSENNEKEEVNEIDKY